MTDGPTAAQIVTAIASPLILALLVLLAYRDARRNRPGGDA